MAGSGYWRPSVKIQVRRPDSRIEVLTLTEPLTIHRCECGSNSIKTSTGIVHFFNSLGEYDEFGFDFPDGMSEEVAEAHLLQYDSDREVLEEGD
jgi:hypothetical protein